MPNTKPNPPQPGENDPEPEGWADFFATDLESEFDESGFLPLEEADPK